MKAITLRGQSWLSQTRRISAVAGIAALLGLAIVPDGDGAFRLALMALVALGLATATGWLELISQGRLRQPVRNPAKNRSSYAWLLVTIAVVVMAGLVVQTWFRPGTTIAGGDLVLPNGTAWIGRLFEPWTWGGSTLGEPSQLPSALPWAAILGFVHVFGGDPGVAQRVWYTTLFVGAGLGALSLCAAFRMGPVAALVATTVYLFNPYVITWVNTYDVYLVALFLLAAIPAAVVAAGTGRLSVRFSAALVGASAPLVGYAFFNPPLVGMILAAVLAAPLLVAWVDGRDAASRSLRAVLLGIALLLAASAYWTVPAILHLSVLIPSQLAGLAGWAWEEPRATIRNAFWLNTHWGWPFPEYFPYATGYDRPPLSVARFVLPALAFGALALGPLAQRRDQRVRRDRALRLAVVAATVALFVIVLSTGTNPPGNIIFDPLFNLPFGWLLREPARLLMPVALAYAVLIAIVIEALLDELMSSRRVTVPALRLSVAPLALLTSVLVGFPMYTGGFVPDTGPTLAPWAISARPTHVQMPTYWAEMAQVADALPIQGALLVMPPDDWYQMPYTWYYGTDAFIVGLFKRRVLVPSSAGYTPASSELVRAVNLTGQSILDRDWVQAQALVTVLNAPLILVRRDIETPYPNHSILPPNDLAESLDAAPNFVLVRHIGSLDLFALRESVAETELGSAFTMINTQTPDLRLLPLLPPNTALVSGESRAGVPNVVEAPRLDLWQAQGNTLVWHAPTPSGWTYRLADVDSRTVVSLDRAGSFMAAGSQARVVYAPDTVNNAVTVSLTGQTTISNGDFSKGLWEPVYDCHSMAPPQAQRDLGASVLLSASPGGLPALQLSASLDSACENQSLNWHGGPLVLSMLVDHVRGDVPRVCLWETGPERCATLPPIPDESSWSTYSASVTPDAGTTALVIYLYADASRPSARTINQYADVRVVEVPALPSLALLADPEPQNASSTQLAVIHGSFSSQWQGSIDGKHVLVDGMLNGWLIPATSNAFSAHYKPVNALRAAEWISLGAFLIILVILVWRRIAPLAGSPFGRSPSPRKPDETR
jgi:hypothetical protein